MATVLFRFFQELNDFLPLDLRGRSFEVDFHEGDTVKNLFEAHGAPHTEVDLVTVNSVPVTLSHKVEPGDVVCVYPVFESFDVGETSKVRSRPLRRPRFLLDVHLGKLAKELRMAGLDAAYEPPFDDLALARRAQREARTLLTRDRRLLMRRVVSRGYLLRSSVPLEQLAEVIARFQLERSLRPCTRCLVCNGVLRALTRADARPLVPPAVFAQHAAFRRCPGCGRVYWRGSHWRAMQARIRALAPAREAPAREAPAREAPGADRDG
jgi:uncharacterized protein